MHRMLCLDRLLLCVSCNMSQILSVDRAVLRAKPSRMGSMNSGDLEMALLHHAICLIKDKEIET